MAKRNGTLIALVTLLLSVTTFAIYGGNVDSPFVFDDVIIRDSSLLHVTKLTQVTEILTSPVPRKASLVSFALDFYFHGLNPRGYRVVNLLIHAANGTLVFLLIGEILSLARARGHATPSPDIAALVGAVSWCAHPVQTQAVVYIWQRHTILSAMFYLIALYAYVLARTRHQHRLFVLSAASGLLAVAAKENAATLPLFMALVDVTFIQAPAKKGTERTLLVGLSILLFGLVAASFLGPRFVEMIRADFERRGFTATERLLTELRVVLYYLGLLAYPHPSRLRVDYDFLLSRSLVSPPTTIVSMVAIVSLLILAVLALRRRPLLSFATLWYFGNLAIESTIIPLDLVYEHRLYVPAIAPIALGTGFLVFVAERARRPVAGALLAVASVATLSFWAHERTRVWRDPVALWEDNAWKSPGKARVHGNLGKAYLDRGDFVPAKLEFERAMALDSKLVGAKYDLAVVYIDHLRDFDRAEAVLKEVLRDEPSHGGAYSNLGVIALRRGDLDDARRLLETALALEPTSPTAIYNLAAVHFNSSDYRDAIELLTRGLRYWPTDARMLGLVGAAYCDSGRPDAGRDALWRALALAPREPLALEYLDRCGASRRQIVTNPSLRRVQQP